MSDHGVAKRRLVAGDLLEIEGWWFIDDGEVCADFLVTWSHPDEGVGGVYRCGGSGFDDSGGFGPEQLAGLVEHTVLGEAEYDFAHHDAYFARELRIASVRDTTDAATYSAGRRAAVPASVRAGPFPFDRSR